jgi:predicted ABC-type ATPase
MKRIILIAGPNGAGKTTFAMEYLPNEAKCPRFVNADLIAAGLSPFDPDAAALLAARLMIEEIRRLVAAGESFAIETTLSGRSYARQIPEWRGMGYRVELIYLRLRTERQAVERVKARVAQGGHNLPVTVIRRRFRQGWRNFNSVYKRIVDSWKLFDNSGAEVKLIDEGANDGE